MLSCGLWSCLLGWSSRPSAASATWCFRLWLAVAPPAHWGAQAPPPAGRDPLPLCPQSSGRWSRRRAARAERRARTRPSPLEMTSSCTTTRSARCQVRSGAGLGVESGKRDYNPNSQWCVATRGSGGTSSPAMMDKIKYIIHKFMHWLYLSYILKYNLVFFSHSFSLFFFKFVEFWRTVRQRSLSLSLCRQPVKYFKNFICTTSPQ